MTGYGVGEANANDRGVAEGFFGQRAEACPAVPKAGRPSRGIDRADPGFAGRDRWATVADAPVSAPPERQRRTLAGGDRPQQRRMRQVIETAFDRLQRPLRVDRIRTVSGMHARIAAKIALHNWTIATNRTHDRPDLAIAGVIS